MAEAVGELRLGPGPRKPAAVMAVGAQIEMLRRRPYAPGGLLTLSPGDVGRIVGVTDTAYAVDFDGVVSVVRHADVSLRIGAEGVSWAPVARIPPPRAPVRIDPRVAPAMGAAATGPRCRGWIPAGHGRALHACTRRPTLRVTGTERLTADLCAQHARMAVDRPSLVRDWLRRRPEGGAPPPPPRSAAPSRPVGRYRPSPDADFVLDLAAELSSVAVVRAALSDALTGEGWAARLHPFVLLATSEALANAIEHGAPAGSAIEVRVKVTPDWATVDVTDPGRMGATMPLATPVQPPPTSLRGRGILLMMRLAEQVDVHSGGGGTTVVLRFAKPAAMHRG